MSETTSITVAKIAIEAPIVSFRYPHFLIGRQPTFDMPPPSTIFGLVAAAIGYWPDFPIQFAYRFTFRSRCGDLEHQHIIQRSSGKLPVDIVDPLWRSPEPTPGKRLTKKQLQPKLLQKTTEATVQPHVRDFLFDVRLELFVTPSELVDAFRSPVFAVVLGRSQDLASIRSIDRVDLPRAIQGYVEHTILPAELRRRLPWGVTTLMPKYVGPAPERYASFAPYIVLRERVFVGENLAAGTTNAIRTNAGEPEYQWFADPDSPNDRSGQRLLWFHSIDPRDGKEVQVAEAEL